MRTVLCLISCCVLISCQTVQKVTKGRTTTSVKVTGQKHENERVEVTMVDHRSSAFAIKAMHVDDCIEEVTTTRSTPVHTEVRVQDTQKVLGYGVILGGVAMAGIGVLGGIGIATGVEQPPDIGAGVGVAAASLAFLIPSGLSYYLMASAESTTDTVEEEPTIQLRPGEACGRLDPVEGKLVVVEGEVDENVVSTSKEGVFRIDIVDKFDAGLAKDQRFKMLFEYAPETELTLFAGGGGAVHLKVNDTEGIAQFDVRDFPKSGARYNGLQEELAKQRIAKEAAEKAARVASQLKAFEDYERTLNERQRRYYDALHYMFCEHTKALNELKAEMNRCAGVRCGATDAAELERLETKTRRAEFDAFKFLNESIQTCLSERWPMICRSMTKAQMHAALSCSSP